MRPKELRKMGIPGGVATEMAVAVIKAAIARVPGVKNEDIEDVIMGCAMPQGTQGLNIARLAALADRVLLMHRGRMAGEFLCEAIGGSGMGVELEGIAGTSAARDRGQGFGPIDQHQDHRGPGCHLLEIVELLGVGLLGRRLLASYRAGLPVLLEVRGFRPDELSIGHGLGLSLGLGGFFLGA